MLGLSRRFVVGCNGVGEVDSLSCESAEDA